ncbi:unnamed protein product [Mytilus edulis]|uniref:Uncharacterized protein n=1 Tax=Mytilus edulis TaxID=6550 RepID=A0A8S3S9R0_MYTED|nr:unnamed protein product [Mytilus edulis]
MPTPRPAKVIKSIVKTKIETNEVNIGIKIAPKDFMLTQINADGRLTESISKIYGRKIPLKDIISREIERLNTAGVMRFRSNEAYDQLSLIEITEICKEYHIDMNNFSKAEVIDVIKKLERTRKWKMWHDHLGYIKPYIHVLHGFLLYDPENFLTDDEFLAKGDYQSEVGDINGISTSSASRIIHRLESRKISENQQKAVQSKCLIDHAEEESNNIDIEIKKYLLYLSKQSKEIIDTINNLLPLEGNRFHLGKINYLFVKHFNIETLFHSCFTLFEHTVTDVSIVPRIVHDKLNTELSRSLNLPTEEEMTTIFQEIEQFETNDLNSIYIEKDSDEELDEDDI